MSRTLSTTARSALYAQETGYAIPALAEITHGVAGYTNPLLIVNNNEDVVYDSKTYVAFPFALQLPDVRDDGSIQNARIIVCAVDQQIAAILRSTITAPTVKILAVLVDDGVVEPLLTQSFTLRNVSGTADTITADLIYQESLDNEIPIAEYRPNTHPGLF